MTNAIPAGPARASQPDAGLYAGPDRTPIPLQGVSVRAEILASASRVVLAQRFRNDEAAPIEAVYVFPVPESAAVCGLAMRIGDRVIRGRVMEREEAFAEYDDALAAGHGALLLDAERPNVFTASVGNILPGQEVVVELTWVAELGREGEAIRFMLPTTVAPRYAPAEDLAGISPTLAEQVSPPVALEVPYGFDLAIDIALARRIRAVESPSHAVRVELDGERARVSLSHAAVAMDRDFVLLATPDGADTPRVIVERNADGLSTAAVSFLPEVSSAAAPAEVIFLVDRSGSMRGSSIEQVRAALQLCLRSLRAGDRFNIVGFGSTFLSLFPASRPYDQASLDEASAHVDALDADLGGTAILPALRAVLEPEPHAGLARQVVLLTDGEVSNEAAVIALAVEHRAHTRVFTLGIGYGASEHLVRAVARASGAASEMIYPGERIEPKVLRQFARLGAPALTDIEVGWEGVEVALQAPVAPPAVFGGEPLTVYARLGGAGSGRATLSASLAGRRVSWTIPFECAGAGEGSLLATLAARAAIRDLEEGPSAAPGRRGSARRDRVDTRAASQIVALATAFSLASSRTSLVAVEEREAAPGRPAELRRVPVALTHGWGAVEQPPVPMSPQLRPAVAAPRVSSLAALFHLKRSASTRDASPAARFQASRLEPPREMLPVVSEPGVPRFPLRRPPEHVTVASLQRADGSWKLDQALARAIGVDLAKLQQIASSTDGPDVDRAVATLAALRFLRIRTADHEEEWRLLAAKAEEWLAAWKAADVRPNAWAAIEQALAVLLP